MTFNQKCASELMYCMRISGVAEKYVRIVQDMCTISSEPYGFSGFGGGDTRTWRGGGLFKVKRNEGQQEQENTWV